MTTPLLPSEPGPRRCLGGCDRTFHSASAGHRICPKCDKSRRDLPKQALRSPGGRIGRSDDDGDIDLTEIDVSGSDA